MNHESSGNQYQYQDQRDSNNNYHQQETQQGLQPHHQPEQVQLVSADELMSFGVSSKQKQQNSKRFRAQAHDESDQGGRSTSSYLMQKSEFEARAGSRDDESGKWLVRWLLCRTINFWWRSFKGVTMLFNGACYGKEINRTRCTIHHVHHCCDWWLIA